MTVRLDGVANDGPAGQQHNIMSDVEGAAGGSGDDLLVGNSHDNRLFGDRTASAGNDVLMGRGGSDELAGGLGEDMVDYSDKHTGVRVFIGGTQEGVDGEDDWVRADVENVRGGSGSDVLIGADDVRNTFWGGSGNDSLWGMAGPDILHGEAGNDEIQGTSGNDQLFGESGNDLLKGSTGQDDLHGNSGQDDLRGGSSTDYINAQDGQPDNIDCGYGPDGVLSDPVDRLVNCG